MKRTPLVRKTGLRSGGNLSRKTRINPVSKAQSGRKAKYMLIRSGILPCQCGVLGCQQPATQIHHKAGRIGDNMFQNLLPVCSPCHDRIHANPEWSYENGYMTKHKRSNENE